MSDKQSIAKLDTSRPEQIEVKVARVEEKIDALKENFETLVGMINDHTKNDAAALAAQLEQNRLLQEKINEVDDFRKKLQYGAIGILTLIGAVWAIFKVAVMAFAGGK